MMNVENAHKGHHHRFMRTLSFQELMHIGHHHSHDKSTSRSMSVPSRKGTIVVKVGKEESEEDMQRFVVPVSYLNHPSFAELLEEAEKEYGFRQPGVIVIPCDVRHFQEVHDRIERELDHHHHHHHHHSHHHLRQHSHNNLQHLAAACFGREG